MRRWDSSGATLEAGYHTTILGLYVWSLRSVSCPLCIASAAARVSKLAFFLKCLVPGGFHRSSWEQTGPLSLHMAGFGFLKTAWSQVSHSSYMAASFSKNQHSRKSSQKCKFSQDLCCVVQSCPALCSLMDCSHQAPLSMEFPRQDTGVDCHFLLQGVFPT